MLCCSIYAFEFIELSISLMRMEEVISSAYFIIDQKLHSIFCDKRIQKGRKMSLSNIESSPSFERIFLLFSAEGFKVHKRIESWVCHTAIEYIRQITKQCYFSLGRLWETGLTRFWIEQTISYRKADKCFVKNERKNKTRQVAIKLQDLSRYICIYVMSLT